jgi:hypothetical protein
MTSRLVPRASTSFALALLVAVAAHAAPAPSSGPDPARIRAHVEFLADDLMEGRAAGTRAFDLAARYVESQFKLLGLRPAGANGTWLQPIPFIEASPVIPAARLDLVRDGRTTALESAKDFLPAVDWANAQSEVEGPLAFVGFGVRAPERGYDDLGDLDLRGRIAVVLSGGPPTFPSSERAHYSTSLTKYAELVRRGAVGVLIVRTPWDEERNPFERLVQASWRPGMRWLDANGAPADAFPELKRIATLSPSGAAALFAGASQPLDQVFADAKAGKARPFALPGRAKLAGQTLSSRRESPNVVAMLEGSDPVLKNEYVVLTAHLDGVGKGAAVGNDSIYNGAMDNATGIAVMLEVARTLVAGPSRPKRSILFVATTAEERGLLGADFFAHHPTVPAAGIVANVNMDMPFASVPVKDFVAFGAEHSSLGPIAERAANAEGYALSPDPMPEEVVFVRSDQYPFVRRGIPALFLDTGEQARDPKVDGKALKQQFLRQRYHQPSDDASQPIDYPTLAGLARINVRVVREVADAKQRPTWNAGDFFGDTYGKKR